MYLIDGIAPGSATWPACSRQGEVGTRVFFIALPGWLVCRSPLLSGAINVLIRAINTMLETKFLRLRAPVELGSRFDDWQVCWLGGWSRYRLFYLVMLVKIKR
jgi:hypothetical protein